MSPADLVLLQRWTERRDAEAFAEIVAQHAAMVYATCKRVLGNAADAEEVAQDCFLRLARADSPVQTSLAGWLHTLATHRSLDRIRSDARRRAREERYVTEAPEEVLPEWDDVRPLVDEAIAALPEELRYPIVAHFLEGETHAAIASTLGISQSGTTRRIQRGIGRIRKSLAQRGVPVALTALTASLAAHAAEAAPASLVRELGKIALAGKRATPLASAPHALAAANGAKTIGGLLVMKKVAVTAAVLVALLLAVFLYAGTEQTEKSGPSSVSGEPPSSSTSQNTSTSPAPDVPDQSSPKTLQEPHSSQEDTAASATSEPVVPAVSQEAAVDDEAVPEPASGISISGYVMDKRSGAPIAGATVTVVAVGLAQEDLVGSRNETAVYDALLRLDHHFQATSRHDGFYQVEGIPFAGIVVISADAKGYGEWYDDRRIFPAEPASSHTDVDVLLSPATTLRGRVIAEDGSPVGDAIVCEPAYLRMAHTDANGLFEMSFCFDEDPPQDDVGQQVDLMVRSAIHGQTTFEDIPVVPGEVVELRMQAPASLTGTILWADGTPAAGLKVWVLAKWANSSTTDAPQFEAVVDDSGHYLIARMDAGLAYEAHVVGDGEQPLSQAIPLPIFEAGEERVWDYTLGDIITIRGHLLGTPSGSPLPGYYVQCEREEETIGIAQTGPDGAYELTAATGEGDYLVYPLPWKPVYSRPTEYIDEALLLYAQELELTAGEERELDLILPDPFTISARVVDEAGTPVVAPHKGCVRWYSGAFGPGYGGLRAESGPEGLIYWSRFAPGYESWLSFSTDTYLAAETMRHTGQPGEVFPEETIVVYRRSGIEGVALDESGAPFANTRIYVMASYGEGRTTKVSAIADTEGRFSIPKDLPATAANVVIEARIRTNDGQRHIYQWCPEQPIELLPDHVIVLSDLVLAAVP